MSPWERNEPSYQTTQQKLAEDKLKQDHDDLIKLANAKIYSKEDNPINIIGEDLTKKIFGEGKKQGKEEGILANPKSPISEVTSEAGILNTLKDVAERIKDASQTTYNALAKAMLPLSSGPEEAAGIIKTFANKNATAMYAKSRLMDILNKLSPEDNKKLYEARQADELAEKTGQPTKQGISSLPEKLQKLNEVIQNDYIDALQEAQASGVMSGGYENYTPRKLVALLSDGTVKDIASLVRKELIGGVYGPKKTMGELKGRKYTTVQETEDAARQTFGDNIQVVKDIRTLPLVTSDLRRVSATKSLLESLRQYGNDNFIETISKDPQRNWMTLNHPAFRNVWIHPDFYPSIEAILTPKNSNLLVNALTTLKAKSMGLLMFNPFVHGTVIYSKAMPYDPMNVVSGMAYMKGGALRGSPLPDWMYSLYGIKERANPEQGWAYQQDAMKNGGFRPPSQAGGGAQREVSDLYHSPEVGNSWTAKLVGKAASIFDKEIEAKQFVDSAGRFWHGSMLWNRITDLGMYIFDKTWKDLVKEGMTKDQAYPIAGHIANRYMGTVPVESMSQGLRTTLNLALFSRQFNVTNMGIYKDVLLGLPNEIKGQIKNAGAINTGENYLKRKQRVAMAVDIVVMNQVISSAIQSIIAAHKKNPDDLWQGLSDEGKGYAQRLGNWFERMGQNPTAFLDPQITPMFQNEPGKQERIYLGRDENGTGMYAKNPFGKVGEDLVKMFSHPIDFALGKQSQFLKLIGGNDYKGGLFFNNKDIFGPNNDTMSALQKVGVLGKSVIDSFMPFGNTDSISEALQGNPNKINTLKATGSVTPVSFSKGFPGGPEKGVLATEQKNEDFRFLQDKKQIDNYLDKDKVQEAFDMLQAHNKTPEESINYIKQHYGMDIPNTKKVIDMYKKGNESTINQYENVNNY